jgi:hypothetical protein
MLVIGQTVLTSWRKMETPGPFDVEDPPSAEVFARKEDFVDTHAM